MAERTVLILNETVPQIQEPQAGDTYAMPADVNVTGNITVSGTVDGRDVAADGALAATAVQPGDNISDLTNDSNFADDQTGAEIATLLFAEPDTNNFQSAYKSKLDAFTGLADQTQAEAGTANDAWMSPLRVSQAIAALGGSGLINKWDGVADPLVTNDVNDGYTPGSIWVNETPTPNEIFMCIDNTAGAAIWIKISLTVDELDAVAVSGDSDDLTEGAVNLLLTVAERAKLAGIEALATADQTAGEIEAIVNHDNLLGFVANEHIDWTADQGGTNIHSNNIEVSQTDVFLGRDTAGAGAMEEISAAAARTILNVEDGSTADQTGAEIKTAYEAEADTNAFTDALKGDVDYLTSVTTGITAFAGGGQGSAVELTTRFNHVGTVATGGDSVKLPTAAAGKYVTVVNKGASAMDLFPGSGDNIDGTGVDTAVSIGIGSAVTLWAADATNWYYTS